MEKKDNTILDYKHAVRNVYLSQCTFCKYIKEDGYSCTAFPDGIPDDLLSGVQKHDSIIESQEGSILFSKKEEYKDYDI